MKTITNKKILFICGREKGYTRNKILIKKLKGQKNKLTVISSPQKSFIRRQTDIIFKMLRQFPEKNKFEIVFVGFYGYLIVPLAKILYFKKPLFFDAFVSTYETMKEDLAKLDQLPSPLKEISKFIFKDKGGLKIFYLLDKLSLHLSTKIFIDTLAHKKYFVKTYCLPLEKIKVEYVNYDDEVFIPQKTPNKKNKKTFLVFYYGTNQALQGIPTILRAAKICQRNNPKVQFLLAGPIKKNHQKLISNLKLENTKFINWISYKNLPLEIARADLCLGGHFGSTPKAKRVIAGKTYQFLAMRKPTIVGKNKANKELRNWSEWIKVKSLVHPCRMNNPRDLANKILGLF